MPELPEVETIVRDLRKSLVGKFFSEVKVKDTRIVGQKACEFVRRIKGHAIGSIHRRGKVVVVHLTCGEYLVIQLMMTGQLIVEAPPKQVHQDRICFLGRQQSFI